MMDNSDDPTPVNRLQALRQQAVADRAARAAVPPKEPTPADLKRADKLERLLQRLQAGQIVQNRDIQKWTTEEEYREIELAWQSELQQRVQVKDKPSELGDYEELLKIADLLYWRGEKLSNKGALSAIRLFNIADTAYERALERLQEILDADRSIEFWLDRDVDFTTKGNLSLCPDGVPRLITSRSLCRRPGRALPQDQKRQVKANELARIIDSIRHPVCFDGSSPHSDLANLLEQASRLGEDL